jgi:hypothetical protein
VRREAVQYISTIRSYISSSASFAVVNLVHLLFILLFLLAVLASLAVSARPLAHRLPSLRVCWPGWVGFRTWLDGGGDCIFIEVWWRTCARSYARVRECERSCRFAALHQMALSHSHPHSCTLGLLSGLTCLPSILRSYSRSLAPSFSSSCSLSSRPALSLSLSRFERCSGRLSKLRSRGGRAGLVK